MSTRRTVDYDQIAKLTRQGLNSTQIMNELGCSKRTINRARREAGLADDKSLRRLTEEEIRVAKNLLEDGASYAETARTIECAPVTLRRKIPGYGMQHGWRWPEGLAP